MKRLVLVGGGHAHLSVLRALACNRQAQIDLTLITPASYQHYSGMLPGWMAGHYQRPDFQIDLRPLAKAAGAKLILQSLVGLDTARRCVGLSGGQRVDYDWLSLDVGSEVDTSWLQTLGDRLLPVKPLDDFYERWPQVLANARAQRDYRLVVVGAGAAGVEIALAARHAFLRVGSDARVDLIASESGVLAGHSSTVQHRAQRWIQRTGVELHSQRGVGTQGAVLLADGTCLDADCVIATTGARAPVWLQRSGLALNDDGYIAVDRFHRSLSHGNIFAAGDVCARPDATMQRSGVHAVRAGRVLADNLIAAIKGSPMRPYRPRARSLYLLACGPKHAIVSWGAWSTEGEWVWRWKDWIDRRFISRFSELPALPPLRHMKESG